MHIVHRYGGVVPIGLCEIDYGAGVHVGYGKEAPEEKEKLSAKEKALRDYVAGSAARVIGRLLAAFEGDE